jgi:hypothetical protein
LQAKETAGEPTCCGIALIFVGIMAPGALDCTGCPDRNVELWRIF